MRQLDVIIHRGIKLLYQQRFANPFKVHRLVLIFHTEYEKNKLKSKQI